MANMKQPTEHAIRRAVGSTIRALRKQRGIAQEDLAYECDVDRSYLGEIERGLHSPTFATIHKLLP